MRAQEKIAVRILRCLPDRWAQRGLAWFFARRFARARPSMVSEVMFVNHATFLGLARDALNTKFGERWATVTWFGGEPYWLEHAETRTPVLAHLEEMIARGQPFESLVIDRSRVRGLGADRPTHPAYHASFSLWRRMSSDESARLSASETMRAPVAIANDAYVFDEWRL